MSVTPFYMLDTNTASYLINGRSQEARRTWLAIEPHARVALSAITEAEILFGLEKKPEATRLRSAVEQFFAATHILPWDSLAARAYGTLRSALNSSGKSLSLMDMLIASHALAAGAILVTHDQAFREAAPFLQTADWATDL